MPRNKGTKNLVTENSHESPDLSPLTRTRRHAVTSRRCRHWAEGRTAAAKPAVIVYQRATATYWTWTSTTRAPMIRVELGVRQSSNRKLWIVSKVLLVRYREVGPRAMTQARGWCQDGVREASLRPWLLVTDNTITATSVGTISITRGVTSESVRPIHLYTPTLMSMSGTTCNYYILHCQNAGTWIVWRIWIWLALLLLLNTVWYIRLQCYFLCVHFILRSVCFFKKLNVDFSDKRQITIAKVSMKYYST